MQKMEGRGTSHGSTGSNESRACRLMMSWTAPATGFAMYQFAVAIVKRRESGYGYEAKFGSCRRYDRSTPDNRLSSGDFRFLTLSFRFTYMR